MRSVELDNKSIKTYCDLLSAIAQLSKLFTDNNVPLINYRAVENIFCQCFNAENLSRSDTAFDAKLKNIGIGLKTFICKSDNKLEKVAEFNYLAPKLKLLSGEELARRISISRNERIDLANRVYEIDKSIYHIVGRREKELFIFETGYDKINVDKIKDIKQTENKITFTDGVNEYSFLFSKSTLFQRFYVSQVLKTIEVNILDDPYSLLLNLFSNQNHLFLKKEKREFIILPLYSTSSKNRLVAEKSGLNQWNAGGRNRTTGELYIPHPAAIRRKSRNFFPDKDTYFELTTPTGEKLKASVCQQNGKAIMSNPNDDLEKWLLRKTLRLKEGELATREKLDLLGIDSVIIYKEAELKYSIDIMPLGSYELFIEKGVEYFRENILI